MRISKHVIRVLPAALMLLLSVTGVRADEIDVDSLPVHDRDIRLSEVTVESRHKRMLHVLAYTREYSSLESYTDTITMFREKMVDFMLPGHEKTGFAGWHLPRVLSSRSYYRFTNSNGLDSVSDRCNQHFTWSDWVGIPASIRLPQSLATMCCASDTTRGKYTQTEIWVRDNDRVSVDVDVLAARSGRDWVPDMGVFFDREDMDFDLFKLRLDYDNVLGSTLSPTDLTGFTYDIWSRGRGRNMFMFSRRDNPVFVTTKTEVYILDKEYITVKEAKKWAKHKFDDSDMAILEPAEAPEPPGPVLALIDRVGHINHAGICIGLEPDKRLISRNILKQNFSIGHRALALLKQLTGITLYKSHKNFNKNWNDFRRHQSSVNEMPAD